VYSKLRQAYFLEAYFKILYRSIVIADKICYSTPKTVATKPVSHTAKYSVRRPLNTNLHRLHKLYETIFLIYPTRCNVTQFILYGNCSTCFGWYQHPSSGVQTTVSTASGICHTVTATCRYSGR
jgi:hypothetical protein